MRKSNRFVSFLVAAILGLVPMSAFAANSSVLSIDPVGWTYGSINLQYENAVSDSLSWTLPISFNFSQAIFSNPMVNRFSVTPAVGLKYYIIGKAANNGLYAHGIVQADIWQQVLLVNANSWFPAAPTLNQDTLAALGYTMNAGYAHSFGNFWFDGFAGIIGHALPFTNATATALSRGNAWMPIWNVGVKIGYAW